jgi:hypothetical protein
MLRIKRVKRCEGQDRGRAANAVRPVQKPVAVAGYREPCVGCGIFLSLNTSGRCPVLIDRLAGLAWSAWRSSSRPGRGRSTRTTPHSRAPSSPSSSATAPHVRTPDTTLPVETAFSSTALFFLRIPHHERPHARQLRPATATTACRRATNKTTTSLRAANVNVPALELLRQHVRRGRAPRRAAPPRAAPAPTQWRRRALPGASCVGPHAD